MTDNPILTGWTPELLEQAIRLEACRINRVSQIPATARVILEHGIWFQPGDRPKEIPRGRPGQCFSNCLGWTFLLPDRFIYCEGMAVGVIPTHHGWLIDRETGQMFDPTWSKADQTAYVGVAFRFEALVRWVIRDRGRIGNVFHDWLNDYPAENGLIDFMRDAYCLEELPAQALHPYNTRRSICPSDGS
jgi:hypothetical protein